MSNAVETQATPVADELDAVFERIPVDPFVACDGHASGAIQALVTRLGAEGSIVYLCGFHARRAGWDHVSRVNQVETENRAQGSDHA